VDAVRDVHRLDGALDLLPPRKTHSSDTAPPASRISFLLREAARARERGVDQGRVGFTRRLLRRCSGRCVTAPADDAAGLYVEAAATFADLAGNIGPYALEQSRASGGGIWVRWSRTPVAP